MIGRYVLLRRAGPGPHGELFVGVNGPGLVDVQLVPAGRDVRALVRALATVNHPNLLRLLDAGTADGQVYLVEEHAGGVPLQYLVPPGGLPGDVVLHLLAALSSALCDLEQALGGEPRLVLRGPRLDEVFITLVGQIKLRSTALVAAAPTPGEGRGLVPVPAALGRAVEELLGPQAPDEEAVTAAARQLAEMAQRPQEEALGCRELHGRAVSLLRLVASKPAHEFASGKLSDLVDRHGTDADKRDDELQQMGTGLMAALPEGTYQAREVRSWFDDQQASDSGKLMGIRPVPVPTPGIHVLGQCLHGTPYRLLRQLGSGGMGMVFLAEHVDLGRQVALKVLHGSLSRNPDVLARFRREARSVARIRHPNVVGVYDFGTTSAGEAFLVMELLDGQSLTQLCRSGPLPIERSVEILRQICHAVEAAHQAGVIHRDLKPDNVIITRQPGVTRLSWPDFVKVLDFGIAKVRSSGAQGSQGTPVTRPITREGQVCGTPEYMAPEQILGVPCDHRADIYALGCIAYEMLAGKLPFRGDSFGAVLALHLKQQPVSLRQRAPKRYIPEQLDRVVLRALAKDPAERFPSMAALAEALTEALAPPPVLKPLVPEHSGPQVLPVVRPAPRRGRLWAGVLAALLLAALAVPLAWRHGRSMAPAVPPPKAEVAAQQPEGGTQAAAETEAPAVPASDSVPPIAPPVLVHARHVRPLPRLPRDVEAVEEEPEPPVPPPAPPAAAPPQPAAVAPPEPAPVVKTPEPVVRPPPPRRFTDGRLQYSVLATTAAYGKRDVSQGLDTRHEAIARCYREAVLQRPTDPPRGNGTLSFAINEDGRLGSQPVGAGGAAAGLRSCLAKVLAGVRFPTPDMGPASITLRLDLEPLP